MGILEMEPEQYYYNQEMIDVLIPTNGFVPSNTQSIGDYILIQNIFRADGGSLAEARQKLIESATAERVMFLDSDVFVGPGPWWDKAVASHNCVVFQMPLAVGSLQSFVSFWSKFSPFRQGTFFGTMATFIDRKHLAGIRIPRDISGAEDLYIMLFLKAKKVPIRVLWVRGMHYHSLDPDKGRWVGHGLKKLQDHVGIMPVLPFVIRNVFLYPAAVAIASLFKRSPDSMRYGVALWRSYILGYFKAK